MFSDALRYVSAFSNDFMHLLLWLDFERKIKISYFNLDLAIPINVGQQCPVFIHAGNIPSHNRLKILNILSEYFFSQK